MKICPRCNQTYVDENLNFCLNDGELLQQFGDDAPPTIMLDSSRTTNPNNNWQQYEAPTNAPPVQWQQMPPMSNQQFAAPGLPAQADKTLPTISLVLGILGFLMVCCYAGFPAGIAAIITGYLGMKNADSDPSRYGGRGLAVGGMILGAVALLSSIVFILIAIVAS
jgi:hypothetical protein